MSPETPEIRESAALPEISLGHFVEQRPHPKTGELVNCLTVYVPDSYSMSLLKRNGGPTHYTPKVVEFDGLDNDREVNIGANAMSVDRKSHQIDEKAETVVLSGCFSVRLNDANPPHDPSGNEVLGKVVHYLVENTPSSRLTAMVKKAQWIDRTRHGEDKRSDSDPIKCKGSQIEIYGEVNQVVDPWFIPREPKFNKLRSRAESIYQRWHELKIHKAKRSAVEKALHFHQTGAIKYENQGEREKALHDLIKRLAELNDN